VLLFVRSDETPFMFKEQEYDHLLHGSDQRGEIELPEIFVHFTLEEMMHFAFCRLDPK